MKRHLLTLFGISTLALTALLFPLHPENSFANSNHIVISEIQTSGIEPNHDFIELYNPTSEEINLGDMKLVKRTSSGSNDDSVEAFTASDVIPAYGFYLWCNTSLEEALECDDASSNTISNNNSVGLRYEPSNTGELIDSVTFGTPNNPLGESIFLTNPEPLNSVERKASSTSTAGSMMPGGADEFKGNGQDTDSNSSDFIIRNTPQPQNSNSTPESPQIPPDPSIEPSPTIEPSSSPSPTLEPTAAPSPTATPTLEPTPTIILTPTLEPTAAPNPTKEPEIFSRNPIISCTVNYRQMRVFGRIFHFPIVSCSKTR